MEKLLLIKALGETKINKDLCEDYDDEGELDVDHYSIPEGLLEEYTALLRGDK